jgi:hypothetical protein
MAATAAEIRSAGWGRSGLFAHTLDWLGLPDKLMAQLGSLRAATLFARSICLQLKTGDYPQIESAIGGDAPRLWRAHRRAAALAPAHGARYHEVARFCDELAEYGAVQGVAVAYHPHTACTIETGAEIDIYGANRDAWLC